MLAHLSNAVNRFDHFAISGKLIQETNVDGSPGSWESQDADGHATRTSLFCQATNCSRGSFGLYVSGAAAETCQLCPSGRYDHDLSAQTACALCPSGQYNDKINQTSCVSCPGFPHALSPLGSTSADNCTIYIGYTSFEEPPALPKSTVSKTCSGRQACMLHGEVRMLMPSSFALVQAAVNQIVAIRRSLRWGWMERTACHLACTSSRW